MQRATAEPVVSRSFPNKTAKRWVEYHQEYAARSTYVYDFVWDITKDAIGPFCTDPDGNVLFDLTAHVASAPLGYNNPKVMDRMAEFEMIDPAKIAGQDFYVSGGGTPTDPDFPGPSQLMDRLTDITSHYGMDTVFLSNSGAEAVENALKICYDNTDGGPHAITFEGAFHGRTLGTLSLNRSKGVYRRHFPEISGVSEVPFCRDRGCTAQTCECGFFTAEKTSLFRRRLEEAVGSLDAEEVSYVILEPIQGEGGYRIPSEAFMDEVAAVVEEHDLNLIVDEIQAGIGRTGEWWGSDHYSIEPDVITVAKAGRVGATIADSSVFPDETSRLSSTWGAGDVLSSMQGVLTIDAIKEYDLLEHATQQGESLKTQLSEADLPNTVDIRGRGLMIAIEFDTKQRRDDVVEHALQEGLLLLSCGRKTIRLLPPLDVTDRELALAVSMLSEAAKSAQ